MPSVTSETTASLVFQSAPSRLARVNQPQPSDDFGALVDGNSADNANNNDRTAPPAADQNQPRARSNDVRTEDRQQQGATPSATASEASQNQNADAAQAAGGAKLADSKSSKQANAADAKVAGDAAAADTKKTLSDKLADKLADGDAAAQVSQDPALQIVITPGALVAIPIVTVSADAAVASAAPPENTAPSAPLAIAAAAIAISLQAGSDSSDSKAAVTAQAQSDLQGANAEASAAPELTLTPAEQAALNAIAADAAPVVKAEPSSETARAVSAAVAEAAAAQADATAVQTPQALALAVASATAKPTSKVATGERSTESGAPGAAAIAPDTKKTPLDLTVSQATESKVSAPQRPATETEHKASDGSADAAIKADAAVSATPTPSTGQQDHHPSPAIQQTQVAPSDPGAQTPSTVQQPQIQAFAAAAVPVAQLTASVATDAAVPLKGLAVEIAANANGGKSRFDIRLDPAELGRIDVRLDVDKNGQVTTHLTVEKPETLALLRQDAPQLQRALEDAGLKTGDNGLQFSLRDQSSSGQNSSNDSGRNAQRLIISDEEIIPAAIAGRSYGRTLGSSSGVDISI